jgi:Rps23 Pro-64 3,4-dihydroxylase Tpa1-like proline 4-hydroxylase
LLNAAVVAEQGDTVFDFASLDAAVVENEPFDFIVATRFLTESALAAANRDFPLIKDPANFAPERLKYGWGFQQVLDALNSCEFSERLGVKMGVELAGRPTTITVRKFCEASDGNIHTDHRSKIVTALLYFNTEWDHEGGKLRMLRSKRDIEDFAAEVPPVGGTLLVFRRTDHSFHGHKRFVGERRTVQMSWLEPGKEARYRQKFDRFSTHLMKRLARLG